MRNLNVLAALLLGPLAWAPCAAAGRKAREAVAIPVPDGAGGVGFDELRFAPGLGKLLAPGGRTGRLLLIDPKTRRTEAITGFTSATSYSGGHDAGTTSADEGEGLLFAIDRTAMRLRVADPVKKKVLASASLSGAPDYVRFVPATREIWVTEPTAERIEIFSIAAGKLPKIRHAAFIPVRGGPESLEIDGARGRAYVNLRGGSSVAIDLKTRAIAAKWPNGCSDSRGLALDEQRGLLFSGCKEGRVSALDVTHDGKIVGNLRSGSGLDAIGYNPSSSILCLPSADEGTVAVGKVSQTGSLSPSETVATVKGARCCAVDDAGGIWVCDPDGGKLLLFKP